MALVEAGPVPKGLEPYGTATWRYFNAGPTIENMFQLPQAITDRFIDQFETWGTNGEVNPGSFSVAVASLSRKLLMPTVEFYDHKKPTDIPKYNLARKPYPGASKTIPFSLGAFAAVDEIQPSFYRGIILTVKGEEEALTQDPEFNDERIQIETDDGYFPDKRWTERAIECAGFIGHNIKRYVEAAEQNPDFLADFLDERVKSLKALFEAHGISAERADGIARENLRFREVPYHGLLLSRPGQVLAEYRMKKDPNDGLNLGVDHSVKHSIGRLIRGVDYDNEVRFPLFELLHLGGADGPITELIKTK